MKLKRNVNYQIKLCGFRNTMAYYYCVFIILTVLDVCILDNTTTQLPTFSEKHTEEHKPFLTPEEKCERFEIHYSLQSAWDVINSPQYSSVPVVKKIKAMWEDKTAPRIVQKKPRKHRKNATSTTEPTEMSSDEIVPTTPLYETTTRVRLPGRQNPFVLVEGTLTSTRRKLLRGLMKHTTFAYVRTMRKSPFKYKDKFKGRELLKLKRAFVTLQLYLTGRDVETILEERAVIMSGFWLRQAAEYISRRHQDLSQLPGVGSACYQWPADLVRPDLVLFLHTPRPNGTINEETSKRLQRVVEIYHRMQPPVVILDDSYNDINDKKVSQLRKLILEKLALKFPHVNNDLIKYKQPLHIGRNNTKQHKQKRKTNKKHANVTMQEEPVTNKTSR